jgi:hypothetical protein
MVLPSRLVPSILDIAVIKIAIDHLLDIGSPESILP